MSRSEIQVDQVTRVTKSQVRGIHATPTVVLIENSTITDLAVGLLNPNEEQKLIDRVLSKDGSQPLVTEVVPAVVESSALAEALSRPAVYFIDVRERNACSRERPARQCIPVTELALRARIEFGPSSSFIVDCSHLAAVICQHAASILFGAGFQSVSALTAADDGGNSSRR